MALHPAMLVLAALAIGGAAALPEAASAQQNRWRDVDGTNVTRVRHSGGGSFAESEPGRWTEFGADGRPINSFRETARDAFSVTLSNTSRGTTVVIDLRAGDIRSLRLLKSARVLYRITAAEARRGGWGGRDDRDGRGRRDDDRDWGRDGLRDVEVGPIWNQRDAEAKCSAKARELRIEWTGQWHTTQPGRMSVCQMRRDDRGGGRGPGWGGGGTIRQIEVGPIWNQRDAEAKCAAKARELRAEWTGQWRTTRPGAMSECEIRFR